RTSVTTIEGAWPDVADRAPGGDVVVCHHVVYNVPDLVSFAQRLTDHAWRWVVVELTAQHPMSVLNDLWQHFHGLTRPTTPTADGERRDERAAVPLRGRSGTGACVAGRRRDPTCPAQPGPCPPG